MRIRLPCIIAIATLTTLIGWSHDYWYDQLAQMIQRMRSGQFVDQASRSQTFLIDAENWLEFELPSRGSILRMLTNAGLKEIPEQVDSLDMERPGMRYVVHYQIIDHEGEVLTESKHHFRTQLAEYIDPQTLETYTASAFGDSALFPAGTRTMQYPLGDFGGRAQRLRLRLAEKDTEIDEVGIRVFCRQERPGYQRQSTWQRISQKRREKICRASVYPPELISVTERQNLLRWQWLPLPPRGLEGVDYQSRILYTLDEVNGRNVGSEVPPIGQPVRKGLPGVIPLPAEEGTARIEFERISVLGVEPKPSLVEVQWHGQKLHQRRNFEVDLTGTVTNRDFPAEGGLLVFTSDVELVIRAAWRPTAAPADEDYQDITPEPSLLQTYLTQSQQSVDYAVAHIDPWPTPFCVALRRHIFSTSTADGEPLLHELEPAEVEWQFLDNQQQVVAQGQLVAGGIASQFEYDMKNDHHITEPSNYYLAVPREARRIRFRSDGPPVLISCFTRPPDLAKTTRVPEDYSSFYRSDSTNRNWFMLRPVDHLRLLEEARTVSIRMRPHPAEVNPELVAGRYLWEDFRPGGFWQARYLLVPRNPDAPIRDEALTATFAELETGRDHTVLFFRDPHRSAIEPRLIYVNESSGQSLDVLLDGALYHTLKLRAPRGEVVLPALPAQASLTQHTIRIRSDGPVRVFMNNLEQLNQPTYLKRLALRTDGQLRFEYEKRVTEKEVLALWFYGKVGQKKRAKLRVQISSPPSQGLRPSVGWTIRQREFDLKPTEGAARSIAFGTTDQDLGTGHVCYIPLGEDLPVGRYTIEIELMQGEQGYVVLSKTTPGIPLERTFFIDEEVDHPLERQSTVRLPET